MSKVAIIIGSKTDENFIQPCIELLQEFGIDFELSIISAHRNPEKLREYVSNFKLNSIEVVIAAAGAAAHLPGVISSLTNDAIPIIGIPLPTSDLKGIDALLSIAQMPGGIPVACMGIGIAGAKNAAVLAAQILGLKNREIKQAVIKYRNKMKES